MPRERRPFFVLFGETTIALDKQQRINGEIKNKAELEKAMEGHIIQKAELMANYEKMKKAALSHRPMRGGLAASGAMPIRPSVSMKSA